MTSAELMLVDARGMGRRTTDSHVAEMTTKAHTDCQVWPWEGAVREGSVLSQTHSVAHDCCSGLSIGQG